MAEVLTSKQKHPDPGKDGSLTSFYLGRLDGMSKNKRYTLDVKVNGYLYTAVFGETNILPTDVVKQMKNCASAIHPTPNVDKMDHMRGGEGRPASQLMQSQQQTQYIPDYDIIIEKEG